MDMMLEQFKTIFDRPEKVKKLREVILDLAVRGKLVEQNPDDEPASVLFGRIKEEKERLIKEKKIKKERPLPDISEEEKIFELPRGWEWVRLGKIGQIVGGGTPKTSTPEYFSESEIVWLTPADLNGVKEKYIYKGKRCISKLGLEKSSAQLMPSGSVLFSSRAPIGYVAISGKEVSTNQGFKSCVPYIIDTNEYIYYYLMCKGKEINDKASGTTFKEVSGKVVGNIVVSLPPLEEQKRIVEKVDSLMVLCDSLEESLEKKVHYGELVAKSAFNSVDNVSSSEELEKTLKFILENFKDISLNDNAVKELKNCILQLAVQGKLVEQDPNDEPAEVLLEKIREEKERLIKEKKIKKEKKLEKIDDQSQYIISKGWSLVRLGNLAKFIEYGTSTKASLDSNKIPVLRMNNIVNGKLNYESLKYVDSNIKDLPRLYLKNNDLLFNRTNSYELVGKTAVFKGNDDTITCASYLIRISLFSDMINSDYINIVMNSNLYRITQIEPEITQQNGQANFNGTKLKSTIIPLPPLEEQKRIVEKVDLLMALCDKLEKKIGEQKEYSNKLMEAIIIQMFV